MKSSRLSVAMRKSPLVAGSRSLFWPARGPHVSRVQLRVEALRGDGVGANHVTATVPGARLDPAAMTPPY